MAVKFNLRIKNLGSSQIDTYVGDDGKIVNKKIQGAIEDTVYTAEGQFVATAASDAVNRNLFLSAMFFQRVVSRTPLDEDYMKGVNKRGKPEMHYADDDSVQDCWVASYRNKKITAKELKDSCGCTFLKFNDRNEVLKIYKQFVALIGKSKSITAIHIENTHERFPMLEFGEYFHDGSIKKGPLLEHGVKGGFSVQAPVGMLRLTEQEFQDTAFNIPTSELIESGKRWQRGLRRSGSKETIKRMLKGKSKIGSKEALKIMEEFK